MLNGGGWRDVDFGLPYLEKAVEQRRNVHFSSSFDVTI